MMGIYFLGTIGLISGFIVMNAKNPIIRIIFQIIIYQIGAFIFMSLNFSFQGQAYIIVYVGAIAILFQFIIMMVKISSVPVETVKSLNYNNTNTVVNNYGVNSSSKYKNIYRVRRQSNRYLLNFIKIQLQFSLQFQFSLKFNLQGFFYFNNPSISNNEYQNLNNYVNHIDIGTYYNVNWMQEFKTITDLNSLGIMIYIVYPIIIILQSILLWVVQIGIISIVCLYKQKV